MGSALRPLRKTPGPEARSVPARERLRRHAAAGARLAHRARTGRGILRQTPFVETDLPPGTNCECSPQSGAPARRRPRRRPDVASRFGGSGVHCAPTAAPTRPASASARGPLLATAVVPASRALPRAERPLARAGVEVKVVAVLGIDVGAEHAREVSGATDGRRARADVGQGSEARAGVAQGGATRGPVGLLVRVPPLPPRRAGGGCRLGRPARGERAGRGHRPAGRGERRRDEGGAEGPAMASLGRYYGRPSHGAPRRGRRAAGGEECRRAGQPGTPPRDASAGRAVRARRPLPRSRGGARDGGRHVAGRAARRTARRRRERGGPPARDVLKQ